MLVSPLYCDCIFWLICCIVLCICSLMCDGLAYAFSRVEYTQPWLLFTPSITQKQKKAWSTGYHCDQTNSIISPVMQEDKGKKGSNIEHKTALSTMTSDSKIQQVIFQTISKLPLSIFRKDTRDDFIRLDTFINRTSWQAQYNTCKVDFDIAQGFD